ncbi:MAG: SRPBCC family protein [Hyphomicrobiales bacterium]
MPPTSIALFRSFRHSTAAIWPFLSRPDRLDAWLGSADIELAIGGEFVATLWNGDSLRGRVAKFAPPARLEITWRRHPGGPETRVRLRLEHDGPGARVNVSHEGLLSDAERDLARAWWREALDALYRAVEGGVDAHLWGTSLPVVYRVYLGRGVADVWPLLATREGVDKWIAHADRFDGAPDGLFRFTSRYQGREVVEEGRIAAMEPEHRIALSWEWVGEAWEAPTLVEFLLEPEGQGCAIVIRHSGFEPLSEEHRVLARRNYASAWPEVLADLKRLVAPVPAA